MTRVLIVEDSPTQAEQLRWSLEEEGFAVEVAPDAEQAIEAFDAGGFDLVVSDIVMPGASGYELCEKIKASPAGRDVPVVLLSALNDPLTIIRALECGADNFLTKPYEPKHLLSRIRTALTNKTLRASGKFKVGLEVMFLGKKFAITSDKEQILDLLMSTFEDIVRTNAELEASREQLETAKADLELYAKELEARVEERTAALQERQEQLSQSQKMEAIGQLTGGMSHDFNNLLAVIIGNLELAKENLSDGEAAEALDEALEAAFRGADLNHRLLAFARRQTLLPKPTSVNDLILSTSKLLGPALGERITLRHCLEDGLESALVDAAQLEAAITNLAVNARDVMPDGGVLTIRTFRQRVTGDEAPEEAVEPGDYVAVEVSDTGTGMTPEILQRACDPFFTTKEEGKGTGLGLSTVHGFMEQSGGSLRIDSKVGEGTVVRLLLPMAQDQPSSEQALPTAQPAASQGEIVLVVEDNDRLRQVLVRQLRGLGYETIEADCGKAALELLDSGKAVDLLLTDVVMPGGIDGRQLATEAAKLRPELRIVLMSGFSEAPAKPDQAAEAPEFLLRKPYRRHDLAQTLRAALQKETAFPQQLKRRRA